MNWTLLLTALVAALAQAGPTPSASPQPDDEPLEDGGRRLRWGLSVALGGLVPFEGIILGGEARIGYQVSRKVAVFGVAGGGAGAASLSFTYFFFGPIAEFSPTDFFYVGGGPILAGGALYGSSPVGIGLSAQSVGWKPGLDLRFGFTTGVSRPPFFRRGGLNIGIDAILLVHPGAELHWYDGRGNIQTLVTFTPMLSIGYDSR